MTITYYIIIYFVYIVCINFTSFVCISDEYNLKHPTSQFGRVYTRNNPYSNTEFEHAVDDDRCNEKPEVKIIRVDTNFGSVRGRIISLCDQPGVPLRYRPGQFLSRRPHAFVKVFLGIPYAEAPIHKDLKSEENIRYNPPQFGKIDAFHYKPACPQNEKYLQKGKGINTTDEDCLYLNIFVPNKNDDLTAEKYAVMLYIHDGKWDHGSASLFPAHMLAASQNVIVITFNYRLGHLGFLATADKASPGNYGIFDQFRALQWVYNNINEFDGDPKRITLFGSGVGAVSASLLALSSVSRGLVKRVIALNGSPVADWGVISDPLFMFNTSQILGQELGCSTEDTYRLVDCISKRSNSDIKKMKLKPRIGWLPWGPVVDNFTRDPQHQFLSQSPFDMLDRGIVFDKGFSYMTGVSRDEGASIFMEDYISYQDLEVTEEKFYQNIKAFMKMYNYSVNAEGIFDAINFMYKPPVDSSNKTLLRQEYIHLLTDRYYVAPLDKMIQLMIKNNVPTYACVLNYTLEGFTLPIKDIVSSEVDYLLLTGAPFMDPKFYPPILNLVNARWTEADRNMSQFMMEAWANFAKEGDPTPRRIFNKILWEPISPKDIIYLNLNATNTTSTMIRNYRERESRFWNYFLPFLIDREPPTIAPTLEPGLQEIRTYSAALWGTSTLAVLLFIITLVCCLLYCRIRSKSKNFEDISSSREIIVNPSALQNDTAV